MQRIKICKSCITDGVTTHVDDEMRFCPTCGLTLALKKTRTLRDPSACPACRARNQTGTFCSQCSEKLYRDTGRAPVIRLYGRVSTKMQEESGLGIEAQERGLKSYADMLQATHDDMDVAWYIDKAESASKTKLRFREHGRRLYADIQAGDHVVFYRLHRAFRKAREQFHEIGQWKDRGVHIHMCGMDANSINGPVGEMVMAILAFMAQAEIEILRERTLDAMESLRRDGYVRGGVPVGSKAVPANDGTRTKMGKPRRKLVVDHEQLEDIAAMKYLRDVHKLTWLEVWWAWENLKADSTGQAHRPVNSGYEKHPCNRVCYDWPRKLCQYAKERGLTLPPPPAYVLLHDGRVSSSATSTGSRWLAHRAEVPQLLRR